MWSAPQPMSSGETVETVTASVLVTLSLVTSTQPAPLIGELCLISGVVSTLSLVSSCPMALAPGDRGLNASGVCLGTDRLCCVLAPAADVVV